MSDLEIPEVFSRLRTVRVGTENPPKLSAVRAALEAYVDTVDVQGVAVASGVPDQPVGFRGDRSGSAYARARGPRERQL